MSVRRRVLSWPWEATRRLFRRFHDSVFGGTSFDWGLDNPTSKAFVSAFQKMHGRPPIDYAGYAYGGIK